VKALLQAELLKVRSTRTPVGLLLATLGFVVLTTVVSVPTAGADTAPISLDDPGLLTGAVGSSFGVPQVVMLLLGAMVFTQEFRYGTVTSTYLGEPRRTRILVAKWLALIIFSVVLTIATVAVSLPVGTALINSRGGDVTMAALFWQMFAAAFVVMAAFGVIGVALGALLRNQIVAVLVVLVWMLVVEQIVIHDYPVVGRWMPGGATYALMRLAPANGLDDKLLSVPSAGILLAAYVGVAVVLALRLTPRRDVF
jgi:ABC-2 type transport system permease protein